MSIRLQHSSCRRSVRVGAEPRVHCRGRSASTVPYPSNRHVSRGTGWRAGEGRRHRAAPRGKPAGEMGAHTGPFGARPKPSTAQWHAGRTAHCHQRGVDASRIRRSQALASAAAAAAQCSSHAHARVRATELIGTAAELAGVIDACSARRPRRSCCRSHGVAHAAPAAAALKAASRGTGLRTIRASRGSRGRGRARPTAPPGSANGR